MSCLRPVALITAGFLLGCAPTNDANLDEDRAAVRATIDTEIRGGNAGDAEVFLSAFSDDAVAMPPNAPAVAGDAFREWTRGFFDQIELAVSYEDVQLIVAGDHAIHHYAFEWTVTPKAGGEPFSERGQGIHILRREPDGSWKITHDIWNANAPPAGM